MFWGLVAISAVAAVDHAPPPVYLDAGRDRANLARLLAAELPALDVRSSQSGRTLAIRLWEEAGPSPKTLHLTVTGADGEALLSRSMELSVGREAALRQVALILVEHLSGRPPVPRRPPLWRLGAAATASRFARIGDQWGVQVTASRRWRGMDIALQAEWDGLCCQVAGKTVNADVGAGRIMGGIDGVLIDASPWRLTVGLRAGLEYLAARSVVASGFADDSAPVRDRFLSPLARLQAGLGWSLTPRWMLRAAPWLGLRRRLVVEPPPALSALTPLIRGRIDAGLALGMVYVFAR